MSVILALSARQPRQMSKPHQRLERGEEMKAGDLGNCTWKRFLFFSSDLVLSLHHRSTVPTEFRSQKRASILQAVSCQEVDLGPLQDHLVLLTTKLSLLALDRISFSHLRSLKQSRSVGLRIRLI